MLTDQQIAHYRTFGFLVFRQYFQPEEVEALQREFLASMEKVYRNRPFDGSRRHWIAMFRPDAPFYAGLMEDPRFDGMATALLGDDAIGCCVDANRYIGDTGWHPDTLSPHLQVLKIVFYLQPVGADSGALRVVPATHHPALFGPLREQWKQAAPRIEDAPAFVFDSQPGDVLAFDARLWHASLGGSRDRWMCTMFYAANPRTPEEEAAVRELARGQRGVSASFEHPDEPYYHPSWLANPAGSARRAYWISRLKAYGFMEAEETGG